MTRSTEYFINLLCTLLIAFLLQVPVISHAVEVLDAIESNSFVSSFEQSDPSTTGKPISLLSGVESFTRNDLSIGQLFPITIRRSYNSKTGYDSALGYGWAHNYDKRLYTYPDGSVIIRKETGWKRQFTLSGSAYNTPVGETGILVKNPDGTFTYTEKNGTVERYDLKGRLASITAASGSSLALTYVAPIRASLTGILPSNIDQNNAIEVARDYQLSKVEEKNPSGTATGTVVTFAYNTAGRLTGITDNLGRTVIYTHDTAGNLTGVTTSLLASVYEYTDSNNKHLITKIDEGSGIYTNTYDKSGRVTKQTHGNGIIDIEYTIPRKKTKVTTTIKDESNITLNTNTRTVEFDDLGQPVKVTDTLGNETRYTRNSKTWITREERWENSGTLSAPILALKTANNYTYDGRGNLLTKTEAHSTTLEKTTTWTYDPTYNKVLTQAEKSVVNPSTDKVTTNIYDSTGNLTSSTITGLLGDGTPFSYTTVHTYDVNGRPRTIDGPRTDVSDLATYIYDTTGNLSSITQPIIGTTTYVNHDNFGNPQTVTDPNGSITTYTYDANGRVLTMKAPGDANPTTYVYTNSGCGGCGGAVNKIRTITLPEGNRIDYIYDSYGNTSRITDNAGNSINYHYDSKGNKLKEEIKDITGTLKKTLSYQYDALNRLTKIINPDNSFSQNSYDALNNLIAIKDPRTNTTTNSYDALGRLISTIQPGSITTAFNYNTNSNLTTVTDPNNNATTYKYDDLGRVYQTISPDTGTTTYTYDPAGNLITKKDAKNTTITYSYDAANRITKIDYPSDTDTIFTYDSCTNGKGRLCATTDASGTTAYTYTAKGQIATQIATIDGYTFTTQYTYDQNGNINTITHPDNRVVTYTYSDNKPIDVTTTYGGITGNIATGISYKPFGSAEAFTYGNGITRTIIYDTQYRITGIIDGTTLSYGYTPDANGNITAITNNLNSAKNRSYTYDALNRLGTAIGPWGSLGWTYDGTGNRITEGANNYTYTAGTNKLASVSGPVATSFTYDNNGNTVTDNSKTFTYNQNQRLSQATGTQTGDYVYNANGQRSRKTINGVATYFICDQSGQLIYETSTSGITADYIYLNRQPIAKTEGSAVYFIHNDHLGTPQVMTDSAKTKVWEIETKPFGDGATITGTATLNLRFPGQYYDAETGNHYNYFRDYNPSLGRYIQADPIGMIGGINPFVYVQSNPVIKIDALGLLGGNLQGGVQGSLHFFMAGFSGSYGGVIGGGSAGVGACRYWQVCLRIGPGYYAGGGATFGGSVYSGPLSGSGGFSAGVGGDAGAGASVGGQASVGVDSGGINSAGAAKGGYGGGYGFSVGFDFCWTELKCKEKPPCKK